jgi:hypothetical protein
VFDFPAKLTTDEAIRQDVARQLLGAGGVGLLGGAGLAGVKALRGLVGNTFSEPPRPILRRTLLRVPVPAPDDDEEEAGLPALKAAAARMAKLAEVESTPGATIPNTAGPVVRTFAHLAGLGPGERGNFAQWMFPSGPQVTAGTDMKGYIPALVGMTAAGGLAGYRLTDNLFGARAESDRRAELEAARERYHRALMGQYDKEAAATAAPDDLPARLDLLHTKLALTWSELLPGLAMTGMGALAAGTGWTTYNYLNEHSPRKAVEQALRQREEELYAGRPAPILVVPTAARPRRPRYFEPRTTARPKLAQDANPGAAAASLVNASNARRQQVQLALQQAMNPSKGARPPAAAKPAGPPPPPTVTAGLR